VALRCGVPVLVKGEDHWLRTAPSSTTPQER